MLTLILLGVAAILLAVIVALAYRAKAKQAEHYSAIQATIAEAATNQVQHRADLDTVLTSLHEKQRNETIKETTRLAERNDFANDFADGLPNRSAPAADPADYSPATTGAASTASHTGQRNELLD